MFRLLANSWTWNESDEIRKYADNPNINQESTRNTIATNILHLPVVLSFRVLWCKTSTENLQAENVQSTGPSCHRHLGPHRYHSYAQRPRKSPSRQLNPSNVPNYKINKLSTCSDSTAMQDQKQVL